MVDDLNKALEALHELNELRDRAKELREQGRIALKGIKSVSRKGKIAPRSPQDQGLYARWIASGSEVEAALLAKVQNHKDMTDDDDENDSAEASYGLKKKLKKTTLKSLFPASEGNGQQSSGGPHGGPDVTVPVLVAARVMQALVRRADTVFSRATMICYYRIVRELYVAAGPDWAIGAARAGTGGGTSAFVTCECVRAILAFESAVKRTTDFFRSTRELLDKHMQIVGMLYRAGKGAENPINSWAERAIERMWLDWYISTNPRRGEIALHWGKRGNDLLPDRTTRVSMRAVREYLRRFRVTLRRASGNARKMMAQAEKEISTFRQERCPYVNPLTKERKKGASDEEVRNYERAESAHNVALLVVHKGVDEAVRAVKTCTDKRLTDADVLDSFINQFEEISNRIHRVLEPAKRYIRSVLNRELANAAAGQSRQFDAGELAFAAASFGASTDWKFDGRLVRACELLEKAVPGSGSIPTRLPFHSTPKGYRLFPIGCEITRSFAQLLQKTPYEFEPSLVRRMLNIFEDKLINLPNPGKGRRPVAWNFDGAPSPDKPSVWVTSVAVVALDRLVRMLNERINTLVLRHFEVVLPEKPHTTITLNDLIYSDYGFSQYHHPKEQSIAVCLERMRAHIMRATLPKSYRKQEVFSSILYGPPGTGKTTLAESLAYSSQVPLVRVSPSDLAVQGQELIERRTRAVFEALSMLTHAVIILDEFEPVLRSRDSKPEKSKSDDPFRFLLTGMLPKLVKLYDAAKRQSLIYCLATNHIKDVDEAARREGRFDLQLPVYQPDPLSRAGALLYRLGSYVELRYPGTPANGADNGDRLLKLVASTKGLPAGKLAANYFKVRGHAPCFEYLIGKREHYVISETGEPDSRNELSEEEKKELDWIADWEDGLAAIVARGEQGVMSRLAHHLSPNGRRRKSRRKR